MRILHRVPSLVWVLFLVVAVSAVSLSAQANDPQMGTWKLNVAKSKLSPGPPPQSETLTYAPSGKGIEVTAEEIDAQGVRTTLHYTANYDGKDYPETGSKTVDTVSLRRISRYVTTATGKKGGKVVGTLRRVVSRDGKTLTITTKGTNPFGQTGVAVFDKQ